MMKQTPLTISFLTIFIMAVSACQGEGERPLDETLPAIVTPLIGSSQPPVISSTPTRVRVTPTTLSTPLPSPTRTASLKSTPVVAPVHRIGIRSAQGASQFYDRQTGEVFVPRGFNYVRLAPMPGASGGVWHATLNPGYYDPERAESALQAMRDYGYNVVRIFIDCCRPGVNAGDPKGGIAQAYLENTIDFMNKANAHGIYVLMIFDLTPAQGGYDELWQQCCTQFDGENLRYLTRGGHTAERRFNRDFIQAMIHQGAPVEMIFAYDLTNEVHFSIDKPPFSLDSGRVRTANGQTYDMSSEGDKQRMMDENLVYWIDQQRSNILEIDPSALVAVSFPAINTGQTTVNPAPAIYQSTADFVDLHSYLGWGMSLELYMRRFGVVDQVEKPIILGEFGAARRAFPDIAIATRALLEWQAASCGYGFDGWLLWTWDVDWQDELWHGLSENSEIAKALAPVNRLDPCQR
jgi:hypothetical protein